VVVLDLPEGAGQGAQLAGQFLLLLQRGLRVNLNRPTCRNIGDPCWW
jgi:hypothetical protein